MKAQRSKSNYRIYTQQDLEDLKFIEECKNLHIPLEEIKRKLEIKKLKEVHEGELKKHIQSVTQQMKQLQTDLNVLIPLFENLESSQVESYSKLLNTESEVLLKSLSELTS